MKYTSSAAEILVLFVFIRRNIEKNKIKVPFSDNMMLIVIFQTNSSSSFGHSNGFFHLFCRPNHSNSVKQRFCSNTVLDLLLFHSEVQSAEHRTVLYLCTMYYYLIYLGKQKKTTVDTVHCDFTKKNGLKLVLQCFDEETESEPKN